MLEAFRKMEKNSPLLVRFFAFIVVPLIVGGWLLYARLKDNLPPDHMTLIAVGVSAPVSIARDLHGVPHIRAKTDRDAFFAVGYVHAQDRLWQLEVQRHMAQGRLSEILGRDSVQQDVWLRTLGLYESAKSSWPSLSEQAQSSLIAYTAGINAYIAEGHSLPPEFRMLDLRPQPWTVYDSLAWLKIFALNLGLNINIERDRFIAGQVFNAEQMRSLGLDGHGIGDNAWAISGRLTADHAALLANDFHSSLQIPSMWYVVGMEGQALNAEGMSMVGLPLVMFGHNDHIAWGGSNMMADSQDLYFERPDPADVTRYSVNGTWVKFSVHPEVISVRADQPAFLNKEFRPITIQVKSSVHGPIISDHFKEFDQPVALRWTALDPRDTSFQAFYDLNFAADWGTFKAALSLHVAPALNMVYADRLGNIGYIAAGRIPVRKNGDGSMPLPGWDEEYAWSGYIPSDQLPNAYNPPSGFLVAANNKMVDSAYPHFISNDWASSARARRIEQLIQEKSAGGRLLAVEDMQQMQGDKVDPEAKEILSELLKFTPNNAEQRQAFSYLEQWQGDMDGGSRAATIFNFWVRHLKQRLFRAQVPQYWNLPAQAALVDDLEVQVGLGGLRQMLTQKDSAWCGGPQPEHETCAQIIQSSLQAALDEIYQLTGDHSMASWQWGALQTAVYAHQPFSRIKPYNKIFERRVGGSGSPNAIDNSRGKFEENSGYVQEFGAGFRQIVSVGRGDMALFYMNSTGQSGNPLSRHYDDMIQPFENAGYFRLRKEADSDAVKAEAVQGTK